MVWPKGKKRTPKQNAAHAAVMRKEWADPKKRKKRIASLTGCPRPNMPLHHTQEHNDKIGAASRKRWRDPAYRKKIIEARKHIWSPEWRENMRQKMTGRDAHWARKPHTKRHKDRQAVGVATNLAERRKRWPQPTTNLERALYKLLACAGIEFTREKRFGRYVVDAFLPEHNLAVEADGAFWHKDTARQTRRDAALLRSGLLAVVHLGDDDLAPFL